MGMGNIIKAGALARTAGKVGAGAVVGATAVGQGIKALADIPWYISMPVAGGLAMAWDSNSRQSKMTPTGPVAVMGNPGSYNSSTSLRDLGASGDLVFSLHNMNH